MNESGYSLASTSDDTTTATTTNINNPNQHPNILKDNEDNNNNKKMELVELNNAHNFAMHRELPVDVPDTFVGVVKQTPRYPPPQPPQRFTTLEQQQQQHSNQIANNNNRMNNEKLRKYSDEIFRKKEEDEFLRSSLRSSKKLQQLQERGVGGEPVVNIAFEPDEEILVTYNNNNNNNFGALQSAPPIGKERESDKVLPFQYLEPIVARLQSLSPELAGSMEKTKLRNLMAIYSTLMQHQHNKMNFFLDGQPQPHHAQQHPLQQTPHNNMRPPSYNSVSRQTSHLGGPYPNGVHATPSSSASSSNTSSGFYVHGEASELLQEVINIIQQNVSIFEKINFKSKVNH